jgi:tRNA threonylcarbamoyladenosine biosynthesis protein TsaB
MNILALDSTTEACSVAVSTRDGLWADYQETARGHSAMLMGMVDEVMARAGLIRHELTVIAFCRGPGSFTGVRISAGVAQGLAMGLGIEVAPVSTLACIAGRAKREYGATRVLVAIDARMGEVYWGAFEIQSGDVVVPVMAEVVSDPAAVPVPQGASWRGFGSGWSSYGEVLRARLAGCVDGEPVGLLPSAVDALPLARRLVEAGGTVRPAEAQPVYLRDRVTG